MHSVDAAFYALTVKQRDDAWTEIAKLRAEREKLLALLKAAREWCPRRHYNFIPWPSGCWVCRELERCKELETP
jgi:hypothetical protein